MKRRGFVILGILLLLARVETQAPRVSAAGVLHGPQFELAFLEWPGNGTPVVLLHGLGGNALWWNGLAKALPNRHVIAVDLPGHGRSPSPAQWAIEPMAREIASMVATKWPGGVIWGGHSWGGKLAFMAAASRPRLARGLILADPAPIPTTPQDARALADRIFSGELKSWSSTEDAIAAVKGLPQYQGWNADLELAFRRGVRVDGRGHVVPLLTRATAEAVIQTTFGFDASGYARDLHVPVLWLRQERPPLPDATLQALPDVTAVSIPGNHWFIASSVEAVRSALSAWLMKQQL